MNVACTQCQTVFRVDPAKVPEAGVRARCSVCSGVFWVRREAEQASPPAAARAPAAPPAPSPAPARAAPPAPPVPPPALAPPVPPAPRAAPPPPAMPRPVSPPMAPPAAAPVFAPTIPGGPPAPAFRGAPPAAAPLPPAASFAPPVPPPVYRAPVAPPAPPAPPAQAPRPAPPAPKRPTNPFLSQDPEARARRLARALVSDIVVYHPAKRRDALRDGSLKLLFEEEIRKSWEEYVEQVGKPLADSTPFFTDALNEILADGQPVFP